VRSGFPNSYPGWRAVSPKTDFRLSELYVYAPTG
jgi:hypothetical protein